MTDSRNELILEDRSSVMCSLESRDQFENAKALVGLAVAGRLDDEYVKCAFK